MSRKAQASIEYMVMLALSLAIFAAILYATNNLVSTSSAQIGVDSALRAVVRLKEASDFIYVHGHPSKTEVNVYIPPNVENVSIINNNAIIVRIAMGQYFTDIYQITKGNVFGNLSVITREGYYVLSVESQPDSTITIIKT